MADPSSSCLCALVVRALQHQTEGFANIGAALGQFRANHTCTTYRIVMDAIHTKAAGNNRRLEDIEEVALYKSTPPNHQFGLRLPGAMFGVRLVDRPAAPGDAPAVMVHEHWIDSNQIHRWIDSCDRHHAGKCHSIADPWAKLEFATELLLIGIERQCLVKQPGSSKYVALSYHWAPADEDVFQTTRHIFDALSCEGAFALPHNSLGLP
ncbi:hypothetical protein BU23DRAFT_569539 [Bimuria novae-zelandiae CBS 107.79]|uniref:Uncharacterized protein n=1 Tax=Bimuria novae-zelandiae CBS 107.79 TaxID=1447943 RepID=A0A6A5VFL6_9PLEO|nr:hypothetical protein BU23DRAFT_569539 [Bimuria novae-zelandiae CBS 107.79]